MESLPCSSNNEGSLDELFLSSLIQNVVSDADKGSDGGGQLLPYPCEAEFSRFFVVNPMGFLTPTTNPIF